MKIIKQDLYIKVYLNGEWYISWRKNIMRHREDGPSNIWGDSYGHFWLKGKFYHDINEYWKEVHENY